MMHVGALCELYSVTWVSWDLLHLTQNLNQETSVELIIQNVLENTEEPLPWLLLNGRCGCQYGIPATVALVSQRFLYFLHGSPVSRGRKCQGAFLPPFHFHSKLVFLGDGLGEAEIKLNWEIFKKQNISSGVFSEECACACVYKDNGGNGKEPQ